MPAASRNSKIKVIVNNIVIIGQDWLLIQGCSQYLNYVIIFIDWSSGSQKQTNSCLPAFFCKNDMKNPKLYLYLGTCVLSFAWERSTAAAVHLYPIP